MDEWQADAILGDNNWLAWLPVRHFLPAALLKQLIRKILASAGENLESQFSDVLLGDVASSQTWLIKPAQQAAEVNNYWHGLIRRIIFGGSQANMLSEPEHINNSIRLVEFAIKIDGMAISTPIDHPEYLVDCDQPSFLKFFDARNAVRDRFLFESAGDLCKISAELFDEYSPLNVITLKYFGDLLLLEGDANAANELYSQSLDMLSSVIQQLDFDPLFVWRDLILQSKANAGSELSDDSAEVDEFIQNIDLSNIENHPLALLNGSLDAYIFSRRNNQFAEDTRTMVFMPQLLKNSHDATHALALRLKKDYEGASRAFYNLQRHNLSLGLYYESRRTFGLWGQTLIEALSNEYKGFGSTAFASATDFLLFSGDTKFVTDLTWPELLVDNYVDEGAAQKTASLLRNTGAVTQRLLIAVTLIESWLRVIRSDSPACTSLLLGLIAALRTKTDSEDNSTLRESAAKAIERITKSRQDLPYSEAGIGLAISSAITAGGLYEVISVLAIAENIVDRLSHDDRATIVESIVSLVSRPNAARMGWVVLRPAMHILANKSVIATLDFQGRGHEEILDLIVKIGAENESEYASLLYQVRNLKKSLLPVHIEKIENAIKGVRENAQSPNRSNAVFNIHALLATPEIVGREGINDALNGLRLILRTGYQARTSPSFPIAFQILGNLRSRDAEIASALHMTQREFLAELHWIFDEVLRLWSAAVDSPQMFADFSFLPSSTPNDVIVHNWALETISFGMMFGSAESIRKHLQDAADKQPQLRQGVQLAFATLATALPSFTSSSEVIEAETRNEFYSKLSRRLVAISKNNDGVLWRAIFERCLTLGPRAEDSAIFVCRRGEWLTHYNARIDSYSQRVAANAELRILLMPLIEDLPRNTD